MNKHCTMKQGVDVCKITVLSSKNKEYLKFPSLAELHKKLFDVVPNNLHGALADTIVCMRCFIRLWFDVDLCEHHSKFNQLYQRTCT